MELCSSKVSILLTQTRSYVKMLIVILRVNIKKITLKYNKKIEELKQYARKHLFNTKEDSNGEIKRKIKQIEYKYKKGRCKIYLMINYIKCK